MKKEIVLAVILTVVVTACGTPVPAQPTPGLPKSTQASLDSGRTLLTADALLNGFEFNSPVDESALTPPEDAAPAAHTFEGRLELIGENGNGQIEVLRGELGTEYASLPEFDFEFVQANGYLIPVQRGLIIADHPSGISTWNRGASGRKPAMATFLAPRCPLH